MSVRTGRCEACTRRWYRCTCPVRMADGGLLHLNPDGHVESWEHPSGWTYLLDGQGRVTVGMPPGLWEVGP